MGLKLKDRVILITGGIKGIGKGIVLSVAAEGAIPIILDRNPMPMDFRAELDELEAKHEVIQIDLNDTEEIASIVDGVYQRYGRIDGVVNNAGANDNQSLENTTWQEFEKSLHGNLTHYFELVHASVRYLKETQGAVVNVGSKTALTGQGKTSSYAAAKGAVLGLTREWAAALASDGVRVNAIVVAEAWTPLYQKWIETFGSEAEQQSRLDAITQNIPLGKRMTSVEEIGDTAAFLLSSRSSHTTGQWIHVDGGYVHLDRALTLE